MLHIEKHRQILFNLITEIYKSPAGIYLGFKGGTMFYFFHGLDRFSVDLDFDLLDDGKKEFVATIVRQILLNHGVIKDEMDKENTIFFLLSYGTGEHGVKIEISKKSWARNTYETKNFYGTDVKVLKLEDAFAHKLIASVERKRTANRDFFDILFFLKKNVGFNGEIILERTGKNKKEFLIFLRNYIDKKELERGILEGLGELLDEKKKRWAKRELISELLGLLDFLINQK
ncbi:MAG: nucleotidyl transferase AbiEii/AbiGii toxin family protein [Parcubacteria group bacterium]|jgi:predicted nucleotidyltransferase component of viral defense system